MPSQLEVIDGNDRRAAVIRIHCEALTTYHPFSDATLQETLEDASAIDLALVFIALGACRHSRST